MSNNSTPGLREKEEPEGLYSSLGKRFSQEKKRTKIGRMVMMKIIRNL
jgi:hypothetical protein